MLLLPNFVEEHLRSHASRRPADIVRGGAIDVESFDDLPPPIWSIKNYSGNYFWTTNVSVPLATIRAIGGFDESFAEYGWEDIDVGLRLRARGVRAVFNPKALVLPYQAALRAAASVERMVRQARAQARTAVQLVQLHPHWRAYLATGDQSGAAAIPRRAYAAAWHRGALARGASATLAADRAAGDRELRAARALANEAYFDELERAAASVVKHLAPSRTDRIGDLDPVDARDRDGARVVSRRARHHGHQPLQRRGDGTQRRRRRAVGAARRRRARERSARSSTGYDLAIALAPRAVDLQLVGATRAALRVGYTYERRWFARLTAPLYVNRLMISEADPELCDRDPERVVRHEVVQLLDLVGLAGANRRVDRAAARRHRRRPRGRARSPARPDRRFIWGSAGSRTAARSKERWRSSNGSPRSLRS